MSRPNRPRYAARLNAFKQLTPGSDVRDWIAAAGQVGGLGAADLNFPDHFAVYDADQMGNFLGEAALTLNGIAMRYYTDPGFKLGAFTHPDAAVRQAALDVTKQGIDTCARMGGKTVTLWMGQDGFDYAFQMDYGLAWDRTVAAIADICAHDPNIDIAIEYKPNEPRAFALMPDIGTTLLACREVGAVNLGVTLDFAHVLYADEMPAHSAALIGRHSRMIGLHLNDGYGKRDDGLMVGSVHAIQTVELLVAMLRMGQTDVIYFDTFPDMGGLNPIEEARTNVAVTDRLMAVAESLMEDPALAQAIDRQDAAASHRIVARALYGS
ncbi:TIM barrel protein [Jannaschia sp. CCS1]|uniref:TIM barrel protein n=1 Tax=Jannaschia sp. (strain CCS1) TaxID=290400 RepID=UPI000053BA9F|nr:TIM barrel protein [Jannaschia sp. CCS1]ABD55025.1 Xylose isomerase-like protein [Jannaschia sp. CCS1]